jgi:hypothetical protein
MMSQVENEPKVVVESELLQLIREKPGISGGEIQKHFYPRSKVTIASMLNRFRRMGVATSRESKWFPVDPDAIAPEFMIFSSVLLSELNSLSPEARENHLASRIQEEFRKNSGLGDDEPLIDGETWLEIQNRRDEVLKEYEIRNDAEVLFGKTATQEWSIGECKRMITQVYDRWWHNSGGEGPHPLSPK